MTFNSCRPALCFVAVMRSKVPDVWTSSMVFIFFQTGFLSVPSTVHASRTASVSIIFSPRTERCVILRKVILIKTAGI